MAQPAAVEFRRNLDDNGFHDPRRVRIDTGVRAGDAISPHYDPMIAKLIVWGEDRAQALARMRSALADFHVVGLANNVAFLDAAHGQRELRGGEPRHRPDRARTRRSCFRRRTRPRRAKRWPRRARASCSTMRPRRGSDPVVARQRLAAEHAPTRVVSSSRAAPERSRQTSNMRATAPSSCTRPARRTPLRVGATAGTQLAFRLDDQTLAVDAVRDGDDIHVFANGRHRVLTVLDADLACGRRRERRTAGRADAGQGDRRAGEERRAGREGRAAARDGSDEDGAHDRRAGRRHGRRGAVRRRRPGGGGRRAGPLQRCGANDGARRPCHRQHEPRAMARGLQQAFDAAGVAAELVPWEGKTLGARYAVAWLPPRELFDTEPDLRAVFNLGAGVDALLKRDSADRCAAVAPGRCRHGRADRGVRVLRAGAHHARSRSLRARRDARLERRAAARPARPPTVGVLGAGAIGRQDRARRCRLRLPRARTWTRTPRPDGRRAQVLGLDQLDDFLARNATCWSMRCR